jgi:deazaflavin-dependent oxidoreductase (nitroreductase family)
VALTDRPPGPLLRVALRAPTWLYRARMGWLLGSRFLCIAHRGRRTGRLRRTVVEVVHFDRNAQEASAVAGWGPSTQWYRNLQVAPAEEVRIGRRRWRRPAQRFLEEGERRQLLDSYVREHPLTARQLGRVFGVSGLGEGDVAALAARIRGVAFRP